MNLPALSGMTVCNKQCSALKVTKVVGWDRGGGGGINGRVLGRDAG